MISSLSSAANMSGISPEERRSLMYTMKRSSVIWESVKSHMMPSPLMPARLYIFWRSSRREERL